MKLILLTIPILFLLLAGGGLVTGRNRLAKKFQAGNTQRMVETHRRSFEIDQEQLGQVPLFKVEAVGPADAGEFLTARVKGLEADEKKVLPEEVIPKLQSKDWLSQGEIAKEVDSSWLGNLHAFDHWTWDHGDTYADLARYNEMDLPTPAFSDFALWMKVHYLRARRGGSLLAALKDGRHLARLLYSQDDFGAQLAVVSLLKLEAQVYPFLPSKEQGEWTLISPELISTLVRYHTAKLYLDPRWNDETWKSMVASPIGLCAGIRDSMFTYRILQYFFPQEQKASIERFQTLVNGTTTLCPDSYSRRSWQDPGSRLKLTQALLSQSSFELMPTGSSTEKKPGWQSFIARWMLKLPVAKESFGYITLTIGTPSFWTRYEELDKGAEGRPFVTPPAP